MTDCNNMPLFKLGFFDCKYLKLDLEHVFEEFLSDDSFRNPSKVSESLSCVQGNLEEQR